MRAHAWFATATTALGLALSGFGPALATGPDQDSAARGVQLAAVSGTVTCHVDAAGSITHLYVRNTGPASLPAGTRIMWGAQPGSLGGVALVGPNGLPSGDWQYVGGYVGIQDCTASVIN